MLLSVLSVYRIMRQKMTMSGILVRQQVFVSCYWLHAVKMRLYLMYCPLLLLIYNCLSGINETQPLWHLVGVLIVSWLDDCECVDGKKLAKTSCVIRTFWLIILIANSQLPKCFNGSTLREWFPIMP